MKKIAFTLQLKCIGSQVITTHQLLSCFWGIIPVWITLSQLKYGGEHYYEWSHVFCEQIGYWLNFSTWENINEEFSIRGLKNCARQYRIGAEEYSPKAFSSSFAVIPNFLPQRWQKNSYRSLVRIIWPFLLQPSSHSPDMLDLWCTGSFIMSLLDLWCISARNQNIKVSVLYV